jgi:chorismate mutase
VKSPRNLIIALLAVATLAIAALAWHQFRELITLRAQLADGDNATLKRQLADARKTIKSLEERLLAARGRRSGAEDTAGEGDGENAGANAAARRGGRAGGFAAMAGNPAFQKLLAIQMRGRVDQTYAALFKSLNLTPDQLNQLQGLLADKQQALMDVMQAAREQGINPRTDPDGFKTLMNQAVQQSDATIQQALGDAGFAQYQQYQQTLPERNTVNSLQQQLSYTQTPLTDDQANQMIGLLSQNQPPRPGNGTSGTGNGGDSGPGIMSLMNGGGTAKVTDQAVTQAQGVLSAPQVATLQEIQQQQQAQQQMQQMMRSANQGGNGGQAPATPAAGGKG